MRINSINPFFGYKYSSINNKPAFKGVPFGVSDYIKKDIESMSEYELECKLQWIVGSTKEIAEKSYKMAKLTEEMCDKKYGKDNWVFVSIGTSPAGIGKALELRDKEVKYLPISELRFLKEKDYKESAKRRQHTEYIKYLDSIGLRKNNINKDDKHYVFVDYTHSGKTLKYLERFAHLNGADPKKTHFLSLNKELLDYAEQEKGDKEINEVHDYFKFFCMTQQMEYYVGIPHIPYYETNSIGLELLHPKGKNVCETGFEEALCYFHRKDKESKQN